MGFGVALLTLREQSNYFYLKLEIASIQMHNKGNDGLPEPWVLVASVKAHFDWINYSFSPPSFFPIMTNNIQEDSCNILDPVFN